MFGVVQRINPTPGEKVEDRRPLRLPRQHLEHETLKRLPRISRPSPQDPMHFVGNILNLNRGHNQNVAPFRR